VDLDLLGYSVIGDAQIDTDLKALTTLRDSTRALVETWKVLEASAATPSSQPAKRAAMPRVDHLGASTFIEKGWSRISIDDAAAAETAFRRALELAPGNPEAETLLAWSLVLLSRHDEADTLLAAVQAREPEYALSLAISGLVALNRREYDLAIELLERSIANAEHDRRAALYAHLHLGSVYLARDDYENAELHFRKALELGPNFFQAAWELGRTLWFSGRKDDAIATWRDAAQANKFSPWGKRCGEMLVLIGKGEEPSRER